MCSLRLQCTSGLLTDPAVSPSGSRVPDIGLTYGVCVPDIGHTPECIAMLCGDLYNGHYSIDVN